MSLKLKFDINNCLESFPASFTQKFVPKMVKNHLGYHDTGAHYNIDTLANCRKAEHDEI